MKNSFGYVFSIKDSIAQVVGLDSVTSGEIVTVGEGHSGIVLNLEKT
jgi:F0F1-type ATP synthase alpha subunit